jgi:hypothetical protein
MAHERAFSEGPDAAIDSPVSDAPSSALGASEALLLRVQQSAGNAAAGALIQRFQLGGEAAPAAGGDFQQQHQPREARKAGEVVTGTAEGQAGQGVTGTAEGQAGALAEGTAGAEAARGTLVPFGGSVMNGGLLKGMARPQLGEVPDDKMESAVAFTDRLCDGVASMWETWQSSTQLVGVEVNAVAASGGRLFGPVIAPTIIGAASTPEEVVAAATLAGAIQSALTNWQLSVSLPGLPLYPAFAAFPGPFAPPIPSLPMPLLAVPSNLSLFEALSSQVISPDPVAAAAARAVGNALASAVVIWASATRLVNILGSGPVPSFAPPDIPVGPVIGGIGFGVPPVLV